MLEKTWKTIEGQRVELVPTLQEVLSTAVGEDEREVHIGTDSQQAGKFTEYVTVIAVLKRGQGGRAFYTRERVDRVKHLRERLLKEVWMSVMTALEINSYVPDKDQLTVHVDANPNVRFESSRYVKELTALVVSQGFKHVLKPDSWVATHLADHVIKAKVMGG
jgi:uncharacterized protein